MPQTVEDNGVAHVFPDDATPEEMNVALSGSSADWTPEQIAAHNARAEQLGTPNPPPDETYSTFAKIRDATSPESLAKLDSGLNAAYAEGYGSMGGIRPDNPIVPLQQFVPSEDTVGPVAHALLGKAAGLLEFGESPVGLGTAGIATSGKVGAALVGGTFATLGLRDLPEATKRVLEATTPGETAAAGFDVGLDALQVIAPTLALKKSVRSTEAAHAAVADMLTQGHSLADIEQAVNEHKTTTRVTTTGETPTPEQEARQMLGSMQPRVEQKIIGKDTQPLSPAAVEQPPTEQPPSAVEGKAPAEAGAAPGESTTMKKRSGEAGSVPLPTLSPETRAALKEHGQNILDVVKDIREVQRAGDLDRATMAWNRKRQQSFQEADNLQQQIMEAAPKRDTQDAISVWREADGDKAVLSEWESKAKGKRFKAAAKAAQSLTPDEMAVGKLADDVFVDAGAKGQAADVLGDLRDSYVPHQWQLGNMRSGSGGRGLATSARFQKARTFANFFEGDQAGFVPKEMAIGKLAPAYVHELNSVIANRESIADISKGKSVEGTPLVTPTGRVSAAENAAGDKSVLVKPQEVSYVLDPKTGEMKPPTGYKVMADQPALRKWQWKHAAEDGTPVLMNADLALHPDAFKRINAMVGESGLRKWVKSDTTSAGGKLARSLVFVGDAVSSEIKKSMFGVGAPFHQVQEGTHAIGHGVTPWGHEPIDLKNNAGQIDSIQNGGLMLMPERFSGAGYEEGIGGSDALVMKGIGKLGAPGRAAQKLGDRYQRYLFHDYIPRLKYATYKAALERNLKRFKNEIGSGSMTEGDVKMLTGSQVNAAYGHLNYALLDRSPNVRHAMQLGMLAPDFLEARSRFVGQALKSFTGSKAGREQLNAIVKLALFQAAAAFTATKLAGGNYDPKHPFEAVVGDRRYTMRSVPEDLMKAIPFLAREGDPRSFWAARMSVPMSTAMQIMSGVNYRGEKSTPEDALGDALANTIPLILRQAPGVSDLRHLISPSSRNDPTTPLEQLAGSAGLKISRNSPSSHAYEMVGKWKDANGIEREKAVYPVTEYQQLRYALEDDAARASDEYEKLVEKMGRAKVRQNFIDSMQRPWTGTEAGDKKFRASLSDDDKELLKLADDNREEIIKRFKEIR